MYVPSGTVRSATKLIESHGIWGGAGVTLEGGGVGSGWVPVVAFRYWLASLPSVPSAWMVFRASFSLACRDGLPFARAMANSCTLIESALISTPPAFT